MVTLADKATGFEFSVDPAKGGELCSVKVRGRELLHLSETGWRGRASWLFPAVGRSRDGMPIHGFARDHAWEALSSSPIVVRHQSGPQTRSLYPFDYQLTVTYALIPGGLSAKAEVVAAASNSQPMPFSLGNHLTLALPHGDCSVATPAHKILELTGAGMLSDSAAPNTPKAGFEGRPRALRYGAGELPAPAVLAELRDPRGLTVRVTQRPNAYFVFWPDAGKSFFCPSLAWPAGHQDDGAFAPGARFVWEMT